VKLLNLRVVLISLLWLVLVLPANLNALELTEDTSWSGNVILDSNVVVPTGIVLTIEPGTTVSMSNGVTIKVHGQLLANGTESEPIRLTHYGDGTAWKQIMFVEAADSRLAHCIIEYSDCEGDHKDYYDDDCNDATVPPSRTYFQAVVALASHIDVNGCIFQKLPDDSGNAEGDAIAIISDDPDIPGEASAHIWNSQFIDIGQGVHTRYSYVLVENCFFTGHKGDNDDVDLYGESTPSSLVLNNLFLNPGHDDMINPTKCSAIIIGNVIGGCDDHGVVLRDECSPVMINNLIFDCSNAGIAVQNQCDALLINNTIYNCGRGIRFFDHTGRWDPPYCLTPGSGKATVVNCIIWNCPTTFELTDSPYEEDRGSHVTIMYSNIEGAQSQMSVSGYSTVTWLDGNIDENPQFVNPDNEDYHLKSEAGRWDQNTQSWVNDVVTSPCIDAGDPNSDWTAELWPHGRRINMGAYGGTAEASMSLSNAGNISDLNTDNTVDFLDFADFAANWDNHQPLLSEDLDRNKIVDINDLFIFSNNWLIDIAP
jgi:parallel beta-helix repeat protein